MRAGAEEPSTPSTSAPEALERLGEVRGPQGWKTPEASTPEREPNGGESSNAYFQATYVWQSHAPFHALYSGPNSLSPNHEKGYTFSGTAYLGIRPWTG